MKTIAKMIKVTIVILIVCHSVLLRSSAQGRTGSGIKLGAYYFDGWTGEHFHLNQKLVDSFPERKPIWGWVTSTPETMVKQIDLAANSGLSFFSFCYYYSKAERTQGNETLNQGLKLYLAAANHNKLQFNILIVNHVGFTVGPNELNDLSKTCVALMKNPSYLKANGKPLLTFYSVESLIKEFGSIQAVHTALDSIRSYAKSQGIASISMAACIAPSAQQITQARLCGFDMLTGYNYNSIALRKDQPTTPLDSLISKEPTMWNILSKSNMPVIPITTLNFDPRPWSNVNDYYRASKRYVGFSSKSVFKSVSSIKNWVLTHPTAVTAEKLAIVYAWNENGEGSWLTPSATMNPLEGLKSAVK